MTVATDLVARFQEARPRLLSLAYRILGSAHDAEDAVQTAWLRTQAATTDGAQRLENPDGWFTTVTARICLDALRARDRRGELPLLAEAVPAEQLSSDEEFLRREQVSRALLVVLGQLSARQRVAYVLHDLFAVPFADVATVLGTSPASAKKLASRARIRLREPSADGPDHRRHGEIIEAFLDAARGGDLTKLVSLMAPDVVRSVDARLLPSGAPTEVQGATAVAEETRSFADRIRASVPLTIDGQVGAVIAPGGHPFAVIRFHIADEVIASFEISPYEPALRLAAPHGRHDT